MLCLVNGRPLFACSQSACVKCICTENASVFTKSFRLKSVGKYNSDSLDTLRGSQLRARRLRHHRMSLVVLLSIRRRRVRACLDGALTGMTGQLRSKKMEGWEESDPGREKSPGDEQHPSPLHAPFARGYSTDPDNGVAAHTYNYLSRHHFLLYFPAKYRDTVAMKNSTKRLFMNGCKLTSA